MHQGAPAVGGSSCSPSSKGRGPPAIIRGGEVRHDRPTGSPTACRRRRIPMPAFHSGTPPVPLNQAAVGTTFPSMHRQLRLEEPRAFASARICRLLCSGSTPVEQFRGVGDASSPRQWSENGGTPKAPPISSLAPSLEDSTSVPPAVHLRAPARYAVCSRDAA